MALASRSFTFVCSLLLLGQAVALVLKGSEDQNRAEEEWAAVMIVGVKSKFDNSHWLFTNGKEDGDEDEWTWGGGSNELTSRDWNSSWVSTEELVIKPMLRDFNGRVEVFLCADSMPVKTFPEDITEVLKIQVSNQFDRSAACYKRIQERHRWAYVVKTRPDFLFYKFPSVAGLRKDRVHTHFRVAWGLTNLTSDHFSWEPCSRGCLASKQEGHGYMNDDMVIVAPGQLADQVFVPLEKMNERALLTHLPANWTDVPTGFHNERSLTMSLLNQSIFTEPLSYTGIPASSRLRKKHGKKLAKCRLRVIPKFCGVNASSIDEVVKRLERP